MNAKPRNYDDNDLKERWVQRASYVGRSAPHTPESETVTSPSTTIEPLTIGNFKNVPRTPSTTPSESRVKMEEGSEISVASVDPYGSDRSSKEIQTMDEPTPHYPYYWIKSPNRTEVLSNPGTPDSSIVQSSASKSPPNLHAAGIKSSPILRVDMPINQQNQYMEEKDGHPTARALNTAASSFVPRALSKIATQESTIYIAQQQQIFCPKPFLCTYEHLAPIAPVPTFVPAPLPFIPVQQPAPYHELSSYSSSPLIHRPLIQGPLRQGRVFNPSEGQDRLTPRSELRRKVMMQINKDDGDLQTL